jgi:hypothetical protein
VICSKFGIDRSRGFQSADPRKSAFPIESLHRLQHCFALPCMHVIMNCFASRQTAPEYACVCCMGFKLIVYTYTFSHEATYCADRSQTLGGGGGG